MDQKFIRIEDSSRLAHALCAYVARRQGIRMLSIKGPVSDFYNLRPPRAASDADVWVDPARHEEFCDALRALGWHERVVRETPTVLPLHSETLIHDSWGCDIDVHHSFPGFFSDSNEVFELMWSRRVSLAVGHVMLDVPSRPAAIAIAVLHGLRNASNERHQRELALVEEVINQRASTSERNDLTTIATQGRAMWVMRDVMSRASLGVAGSDITPEQQRLWDLNRTHGGEGSTVGWWIRIKALPLAQRPATLLRAVWVPRREIPRNIESDVPSFGQAWSYQTQRWSRGIRATKSYLCGGLWRSQRPGA